ncbi:MAG: hypothetical protein ACTSXY_04335 [Promethearchaeota archaeon]
MKKDNLNELIKKIKEKRNQQMKVVSFNVKAKEFDCVKEYLEMNNISFSSVVNNYIQDLAKDVEKKDAKTKNQKK